MGLYDYVNVEVPLPDGKPAKNFQTKDFENPYLETYTIRPDGRLFKSTPWYDDGGDGEGKDMNFHGILNFYTDDNDVWREFNAKFTDGALVEIVIAPRNI